MSTDSENSVFASAHRGDFDIVKEQVDLDKSLISKQDSSNRILLHWGALGGNVKLVEYLLDLGSLVDAEDDTNTTPLILAASAGRTEAVDLLIKHKADVNHKSVDGHSALQYSCSKGWFPIAKMLLENNANINVADVRGATPLHRASSLGKLEIVKLLLEYPLLSIDLRDFYGNSALHLACEEDRQEEAKLLVRNGADLHLTNKDRQTPLDLCNIGLAKALLNLAPN